MTDELELATRNDFRDLQQGTIKREVKWRWDEKLFNGEQGHAFPRGSDCRLPYGAIEPHASGDWFESTYAGGSDYSGGSVCESNYRVLVRECERIDNERGRKEGEPTFWQTFYGGHGTYAIAFHVEKTPKEVFEMLAALENYHILDEHDHSELELEQQEEAWKNWAASDYRRALEKHFDGDAGEVSDDDLFEHFHVWAEKANRYWEGQNGAGQWIDVDAIAKAADEPPDGFVRETEESDGAA